MKLSQEKVNQLIKTNLPMPSHIRNIEGDVTITSAYTHGDSWSAIEGIGGYLHLEKDVHAELSALTSIGSSLYLEKDAHANLSALTSIGGSLHIDDYTELLPAQLRHLETRENYKLIYQAEDIANQVASSGDISVIRRRTSL